MSENHKNGETFMNGKGKNMTDIRNIIHRLRMNQSIRCIHRELGIYRPIIRELRSVAIEQQWLNAALPMPSDEEISKVWSHDPINQPHLLDPYKEQLAVWDKEGLSSTVVYQLLRDKCNCDVQAIRRYRNKHFPKPTEPVMVRSTVPG